MLFVRCLSEISQTACIISPFPECNYKSSLGIYKEGHLVADLGWDELILIAPPPCPVAMPILPDSHLPQQNLAESGKAKNEVNPTQVRDPLPLPVQL